MTYAGYNPHVKLGRKSVPDSAPMGGDQVLMNDVPIRPISMVGNLITFDVALPYRVSLGWLPKGAAVFGAVVAVTAAFNAGTTNVLVVGTRADIDNLVEAGDVNEAAVGTALVCHRGGGVLTEDTEYFVQFTQTGGAATTGEARVGVLYAIP
jgi:hypothetical protein